jgi:hypothetical protein
MAPCLAWQARRASRKPVASPALVDHMLGPGIQSTSQDNHHGRKWKRLTTKYFDEQSVFVWGDASPCSLMLLYDATMLRSLRWLIRSAPLQACPTARSDGNGAPVG